MRKHGMVLMEIIVYVLLVIAIVGVMSSTVFIAAQSLRKRAERELKDEHWLTLVGRLRDDLRSAQQVHWKPPATKGQPEVLVSVQRPDGTKVEVLRENQRILRRVTETEGKTVETPYPFQTTAWKLSVPRDGAKGPWDLQELPADAQFTIGASPLFFYVTVTVHGQDQRMITEQFGVATRCEGVREVKP